VINCGIIDSNAGHLIAEAALAIEMGSETAGAVARVYEGTITKFIQP
jgi:pyruvate/2-oxoglutarate dehydrogenase complex dihydrolipoamide dehydrogenase (E3) component